MGVLSSDGSAFLDRQELSAREERTRHVILGIPHLGNSSDIVFMGSSSGAGRVRVEALSLVLYSTIPRNGLLSVDLPLSDFTTVGAGNVRSGRATVDVPPVAGAYGAQLALPSGLRLVYPGDPALITIRLRTIRGAAGIGVLNQDGSAFLDMQALSQSDKMQMVYLGVDNLAEASSIVVYGGSEPLPARVQIESVAISL
jgi:hypothetical protein